MCRKIFLTFAFLFCLSLCYSEGDSSQAVLQQINDQSKLAQNIVVRLVESLNLREATLQKDKENLESEKSSLTEEKAAFQLEKLEFQKEKDSFEKQKIEQQQTEQTLQNLDKSYQTLLNSQKRNEKLLWGLGGVTVASIVTTIVVALIK